jgi:hypothetical protein
VGGVELKRMGKFLYETRLMWSCGANFLGVDFKALSSKNIHSSRVQQHLRKFVNMADKGKSMVFLLASDSVELGGSALPTSQWPPGATPLLLQQLGAYQQRFKKP